MAKKKNPEDTLGEHTTENEIDFQSLLRAYMALERRHAKLADRLSWILRITVVVILAMTFALMTPGVQDKLLALIVATVDPHLFP